MKGGSSDPTHTMRQLRHAVSAADLSGHDTTALKALLNELRRTERSLTALNIKISQRNNSLNNQGAAPDTEEALLNNGDVSGNTARKERNRERVTSDIPELGDALNNGTIGGEHLDAVSNAAKNVDPEHLELFNACTGDLVNRSDNTPVDTFNKQVRRIAERIRNDHGLATAAKQRDATNLSMWKSKDGMGHLRGDFDPETYEAIRNGVARQAAAMAAAAAKTSEPVTKGKQLDALALAELVRGANGARGRADISVIIDSDTLISGPHEHSVRETLDGEALAYETVRRLCCDALIRKVVLDATGTPIDVGRAHRTATDRQWVALKAIYQTCAWSQCDRPITWCQAHHVIEWENGGPTDLDNLVPLCSRHHHAVHEGQWDIKLLPDRTLRIFRPDGQPHATTTPDRRTSRHRPGDDQLHPPGMRQPTDN